MSWAAFLGPKYQMALVLAGWHTGCRGHLHPAELLGETESLPYHNSAVSGAERYAAQWLRHASVS